VQNWFPNSAYARFLCGLTVSGSEPHKYKAQRWHETQHSNVRMRSPLLEQMRGWEGASGTAAPHQSTSTWNMETLKATAGTSLLSDALGTFAGVRTFLALTFVGA